jgi:predicted RNA-binding Zn-ribbon protein involved in translation (DUF1610 family)
VRLIAELGATKEAATYFHIQPNISIEDRLMDFSKDSQLEFIVSLGSKGELALNALASAFPLRRPPTLYIGILENHPLSEKQLDVRSKTIAKQGRKSGIRFDNKATIRFIYLPQSGVKRFSIKGVSFYEFQLQYEYRFEYIESDPEADDYGQLTELYSLETAFVWIPIEKHKHTIIACCDYSALRRIRYFLEYKLGIVINPPFLNKEMLEKITQGANPRSATYSLQNFDEYETEIQNITISDPLLQEKELYKGLSENPNREQISGFYTAHPGLALGGIGVARRDGKIWTPRRLDYQEILNLSLTLIRQTESQLSQIKDVAILTNYFFHERVRIGDKELHGDARNTWGLLIPYAFSAYQNDRKEIDIPTSLLNKLIIHQRELGLLTTVEYDCPSCGIRWLTKCPECTELLTVEYKDAIQAICPNGHITFYDHLECHDCKTTINIDDFTNYVRILPDVDLNKSIYDAGRKFNQSYKGSWIIQGLTLKQILPRPKVKYPQLKLLDLQLWKAQAKLGKRASSILSRKKAISILNKTKEKCKRGGTLASTTKCTECINNPIDPNWIIEGDTCLLRLFGIPINQKFDGIHHGHEVADLRYKDSLVDTREKVNIGIHVKSRHPRNPPEGMGRKSSSIKGLYTQVLYSAYQAAIKSEKIQVIGISMPNPFHKEVTESLAYAVNTLGFSFIVIDDKDWLNVVGAAYEQSLFDQKPR